MKSISKFGKGFKVYFSFFRALSLLFDIPSFLKQIGSRYFSSVISISSSDYTEPDPENLYGKDSRNFYTSRFDEHLMRPQ